MMGDIHPFKDPYIKENIQDALYKYAKYINKSVYIHVAFSESIIAPELLDMMIDSKFEMISPFYKHTLVECLETQLNLFKRKNMFARYTDMQIEAAIVRYTQVIEKLRKG